MRRSCLTARLQLLAALGVCACAVIPGARRARAQEPSADRLAACSPSPLREPWQLWIGSFPQQTRLRVTGIVQTGADTVQSFTNLTPLFTQAPEASSLTLSIFARPSQAYVLPCLTPANFDGGRMTHRRQDVVRNLVASHRSNLVVWRLMERLLLRIDSVVFRLEPDTTPR